ncbi:MAG: Yip1 family protein [Proteobacteria bacterium]|nr:Yip1 family protein [Pseudomonadota bacterium]
MFDIQATIKWVRSVLTDPNGAAAAYREAAATWQQSFMQLVLPVYVAAFIVSSAVALFTGGAFLFGSMPVGFVILALVWSLGWTFVIAFIFDYLAGVFEGKRNFDAAYSVVALAIVPSAIGSAIAPLPWIGWLISLAAGIYSLMLAYRFLPQYLEIPEASRFKHFVLSIIIALVVNIFVSMTMATMFAPAMISGISTSDTNQSQTEGGILGGFERQADFAEAASNDRYDPPADGEVTTTQMEKYVDVLRKTKALRDRLGQSLKPMEDKEPSLTDIFSGVGDVVRLSTAEMEVVKTGGGNWAEHLWVQGQIETARVQQDLNDTTAHNYALFLKFQDQIEQVEQP